MYSGQMKMEYTPASNVQTIGWGIFLDFVLSEHLGQGEGEALLGWLLFDRYPSLCFSDNSTNHRLRYSIIGTRKGHAISRA